MRTFLPALTAAALLASTVLPASADAVFDFYKLGRGVAGGDFRPTDGVACTGADLCSSAVDAGQRSGDLTYVSNGVTAVATGSYNGGSAAVVQDSDGGWTSTIGAGLGVYHLTGNTSDDNITTGEMLTISFDQIVRLTSIGLRSDGHNFTAWSIGATFLFDGVSTTLPLNIGRVALDRVGQSFSFAFGGASADQFYLSSMAVQTINPPQEATVPEPGSAALLLAALGAVGVAGRRRRGKPAQAA